MILALDLGTVTGWACGTNEDGRTGSGIWTLQTPRQRRFESPGMKWRRLDTYLKELDPETIIIEEVRRHAGTDAAHAYGGALAVVQAYSARFNVLMGAVPVGTIKKHATGKGNASKAAMVKAAIDKLDLAPHDDNEADAAWILDYVLEGGVL